MTLKRPTNTDIYGFISSELIRGKTLNRLREELFLCDSVILARIAFQAGSASHIFHLRQARSGCYPLVTLTPSALRPRIERVRDLLREKQ